MNYEKNNGKRRKLFNSINNDTNQVHNPLLSSQIRNINKILKILEKSYVSCSNYDSTQQLFFSDINTNNFVINFQSLYNYNIPETLNRNIILIYKILG